MLPYTVVFSDPGPLAMHAQFLPSFLSLKIFPLTFPKHSSIKFEHFLNIFFYLPSIKFLSYELSTL